MPPNNEVIGEINCLLDGEQVRHALPQDQIRDGFNVACFTPAVPLDPLWEIASSYNSCSLQFFYATVIQWIYNGEEARIQAAFALLLGPTAMTTLHPRAGFFPALVTVITPQFSIGVMSGTDNYQQFALQGFYTLTGPVDVGIFSCNFVHYSASTWLHLKLVADGAAAGRPVFLVGHSYGGAAASILAGRYINANVDRDVRTLTFGEPKPGDVRLYGLLQACPGISLQNFEDFVCTLPPDYLTIAAVSIALALPGLLTMTSWHYVPNRTVLQLDGSLSPNTSPAIGFTTMLNYTNRALLNLPIAVILDHEITIYRERTLRRCPDREWPISLPLWNLLQDLDLGQYWADDYFGGDYFGDDYWY